MKIFESRNSLTHRFINDVRNINNCNIIELIDMTNNINNNDEQCMLKSEYCKPLSPRILRILKVFAAALMFYLLPLNIFLCANYAYGAGITAPIKNDVKMTKTKIHITSNSLVVNNKKKIAIFSGKVIAIKKNLKIFSHILTVFYNKKNKIKQLIAIGSVHIIKGKDNITGNKAVFNNTAKTVVITGHPYAWSGKNKITGKIIEMNLATGISKILSGQGQRVNAVIYSKKSLAIKKNKPGSIKKNK
jgi:lipopolysaccharide export system protein LptA